MPRHFVQYESTKRHFSEPLFKLFGVISPSMIALQADYVTMVKDRPIMSEISAQYHIVSQLHLTKTDPGSSRTVSWRQLSFLF